MFLKYNQMKKYLLSVSAVLFGISICAQVPLTYVGNSALVTVQSNALVYNGGGFQTVGSGEVDNYGNIMIVGSSADKFQTAAATNFVLKYTDAANYGQLYISGITQTNLSGNLTKEYRGEDGGSYQQSGMPFYQKTLYSLGSELGKSFSNIRYSQNEILKYDAPNVVAANTDVYTAMTEPAAYYMLGTKGINFSTPFSSPTGVFKLVGRPVAEGVSVTLTGANSNVPSFGTNGFGKNIYNEYFNSYLQDPFVATAWTGDYGKNIYQYSNPYLTNIDLSGIYKVETGGDLTNDGNYISNIQGIRFSPGKYIRSNTTGTFSTTGQYLTFSTGNPRVAVGDYDNLIIRPLQTFVIKLADGNAAVAPATLNLNFDKLRRFKDTARNPATAYSVTAARNANANTSTVKQLGVIALDADGNEMGRTYFVVYNNGVSGYNPALNTQVVNNSDNVIGTFEENATDGGIDPNYENKYWLYINEVNEQNFKGKAVPMMLYNTGIKTLKFQIRENEALLPDGNSDLSTGVGFYYRAANGSVAEISQGESIPVTADNYSLYYGKPDGVLGTDGATIKANRTQITYNPAIDNYIVRFDPNWNKAQIQVYDASGKLVLSKKNVSTAQDFVIQLNKDNRAYVVTATSEKGEIAVAKIIR